MYYASTYVHMYALSYVVVTGKDRHPFNTYMFIDTIIIVVDYDFVYY